MCDNNKSIKNIHNINTIFQNHLAIYRQFTKDKKYNLLNFLFIEMFQVNFPVFFRKLFQ